MFSHAIKHTSDTVPVSSSTKFLPGRAKAADAVLPYDARIEYLESNGAQYIDTGIVPSSGWRAICDFARGTVNGEQSLFGQRTSSSSSDAFSVFVTTNKIYPQYAGTQTNLSATLPDETRHIVELGPSSYLDGVLLRTVDTAFTGSYSIYVFAKNQVGSWTDRPFIGRIYSFKIWNSSDTLVFDGIPVRVGSVGYLYDKVSGQLFSTPTGAFVLGQDVVPVEYVESNGSQYVDTGIIPKASTFSFDCDIMVLAAPSETSSLFGARNATGSSGSHSYNAFLTSGRWIRADMLGSATNMVQINLNEHINISYNLTTTTINGTSQANGTKTDCSYPFYIFAHNNAGDAFERKVLQRVYSFKLYESGTLVRNFVPVRIGTAGYLLDKVSGELFGSTTSTSLIPGRDVPTSKFKPVRKHYDMAMSYLRNECNGSALTSVNTSFPSGKYTALDYTPTYVHHLFTGWGTTPYYDSEVDYIELAGTQFLDTKLYIDPTKQNVKSTCRIQFTGTGRQLMGFASIDNGYWGVANGGTNYEVGGTTTTTTSTTMPKTGGVDTLVWEHFTDANQTLTLKGTGGASDLLITRSKSTIPGTYKIGAIPGNSSYRCVAKIYAYTIEVDGKVVRDYVPVRCGTIGMLYDKVTNQMFPSSTNTSFIAGNDVPAGCELVDYVEFTGTDTSVGAYVDTGITPGNNDIQFEIRFLRNYSISAYNYIIGATSDSSTGLSNTGAYGVSYSSNTSSGGIRLNCLLPADAYIRVPLSDLPMSEVVTARYTGHSCIVNGVEYQAGGTHTECEYPLYIGANNKVGSVANVTRGAYVYYCKIWKGGVLVRDFVPVKDSNDVGALYDKVSGQLFYSQNQSIPLNAAATYTPPTGTEILPSDQVMYHVPMLYARWQLPTTVTFDATTNGGAMPSGWTPPDYYEGQPFGTLPIPTKSGQLHIGWFDGSGNLVTESTLVASSNTSLTARYAAITYDTSFEVTTASSYRKAGIYSTTSLNSSNPTVVDWGDGTYDVVYGNISQLVHTYSSNGTFTMRVNDSISSIALSINNSTWYGTTTNNSQTIRGIAALSGNITSLPNYAFYNCQQIRGITLSSGTSTLSLGTNAFAYCFYQSGTTGTADLSARKITSIPNNAFYYCRYLSGVVWPQNTTSIGGSAFRYCFYYEDSAGTVEIPEGVTSISSTYAFANCPHLTAVTLPSTLTNLNNYTFYYCMGLATITSNRSTAPTVSSYTFGSSTSTYTGRTSYNAGTNRLIVPAGATGYNASYWSSVLLDSTKCGFTLIETT